jgi:hypothetical protein
MRTRDGGRFGVDAVHKVLTRTTYIGEHKFNYRDYRTKAPKPESGHAIAQVPPIVTREEFQGVQDALRLRSPRVTPSRFVTSPVLPGGICFCGKWGGAMTLRTRMA